MAEVEVFSAGCPTCQEATEMVKRVAGPSNPVVVLGMHQADVAARAKRLGITRLPSVVIDGMPQNCCTDRGPDEPTLRTAMGG
jgi:hypothetical protein